MKPNSLTNLLLLLIAALLATIAFRHFETPTPVQAQDVAPYPFFFEPGTYLLRTPDGTTQVYGKVAIDMRNGRIWGFPTGGPQPFPVNMVNPKPVTTHPFDMGRFALEDTDK
ncbi:MAG TPA: hypothetical protein VK627_02415 [Edaphobacter sp.]|jgi:hypothetical protein|nr:hypothetical protein [Edaphobacter sp.]